MTDADPEYDPVDELLSARNTASRVLQTIAVASRDKKRMTMDEMIVSAISLRAAIGRIDGVLKFIASPDV